MKKTTSLVLATLLAGTVTFAALTPIVSANDDNRGKGQQHGQKFGQRGAGGPGGFIRLMCSDEGAARMETIMGKQAEKLELTADQQVLFDTFKGVALAAQTQFADNCVAPVRGDDKADKETRNPIDGMKTRQANMAAQLAAMDDVIPSLEAFFDSLTDEQKEELRNGHGPRGGKGHRGSGNGHGPRGNG